MSTVAVQRSTEAGILSRARVRKSNLHFSILYLFATREQSLTFRQSMDVYSDETVRLWSWAVDVPPQYQGEASNSEEADMRRQYASLRRRHIAHKVSSTSRI